MDTYLEQHPTFYVIRVQVEQSSSDIVKYDGRLRHFNCKKVTDITKYIMPHDINSIIVRLIMKENCGTASRYDEGTAPSFYDII